jgi:hypothetical protein
MVGEVNGEGVLSSTEGQYVNRCRHTVLGSADCA